MDLFLGDLQGDEVMLLVEPPIVEQQGIPLSSGKPAAARKVKRQSPVSPPSMETKGMQECCGRLWMDMEQGERGREGGMKG